jgi:hypothetical protein
MKPYRTRPSDWVWRGVYLMWPITYAILVYDDLTHHETWAHRLMPIFTSDLLFAAVWPGTWIYWIVRGLMDHSTALSRLVGF